MELRELLLREVGQGRGGRRPKQGDTAHEGGRLGGRGTGRGTGRGERQRPQAQVFGAEVGIHRVSNSTSVAKSLRFFGEREASPSPVVAVESDEECAVAASPGSQRAMRARASAR